MIKIQYVADLKGASRFATCNGCGKSSKNDKQMVAVRFEYGYSGALIYLCDKCRRELYEKI